MEINLRVIVPIVIIAAALVYYLIRRNQKDEKEVEKYFIDEAEGIETEEDELNNER